MTRLDDLRRRGLVQRVPVDELAAGRLLEDARRHLHSARAAMAGDDLAGAYQLLYDAARKSVTALVAKQGLRVRGQGAHATLVALAVDLFGGLPGGAPLRQLDRMRRVRNDAEYQGRWFDEDEVADDLVRAEAIVAFAVERFAADGESSR